MSIVMLLSIISLFGMLYLNPSFGISNAVAKRFAERSAGSVLSSCLQKCGVGFSSKNRWYSSCAMVKCWLPLVALLLTSMNIFPLFDFSDSPHNFSDSGLYIVNMFFCRSTVFILMGSLVPRRSSYRIFKASSSAVSMLSFAINPIHFDVVQNNILERADFFDVVVAEIVCSERAYKHVFDGVFVFVEQ